VTEVEAFTDAMRVALMAGAVCTVALAVFALLLWLVS